MKTFIPLILLSLSLNSSAQKIRFTDNRNEWVTLSILHDSPPGKNNYKYYTDTFAFGNVYKQIHNIPSYYYCGTCPGAGGCSPMDNILVREDTTTGKVYYRNLTVITITDSGEHLLYNYNARVGDTIVFTSGFGPIIDTVSSIDSILIYGVYYKVIGMRRVTHAGAYFVLEGMGCTNGPLFPTYFIACFEYSESLSCFSQSGIYPPIHSIPLGACGSFATYCCTTVLDSFDNIGRCATVLSSKNTASHNVIAATPNPVNGFLNIATDQPFGNNSILSINDLTGTSIYHAQLTEQQHSITINTNGWHTGVYLLTIQNNAGILKREKIVVVK